jgi:hypothetical protein
MLRLAKKRYRNTIKKALILATGRWDKYDGLGVWFWKYDELRRLWSRICLYLVIVLACGICGYCSSWNLALETD